MSDADIQQEAPSDEETPPQLTLELSDEAREKLLRITVGYDDVCRLWKREESVRIKVLTGLLEMVCHLTKTAEGDVKDGLEDFLADLKALDELAAFWTIGWTVHPDGRITKGR